MNTPPFETIAFVDGSQFDAIWNRQWTTRVHHAGTIQFPSGRVVVSDALCTDFATHPKFERRAPPVGEVYVSVAHSTTPEGKEDSLLLCSWVRFSDHPIEHWEPAYYEGFDPDDTYAPGFGVDSGTACIADFEAATRVDDEAHGERLLEAINATQGSTREFCFHPDESDGFFVSRSGLGDGFYESYWGLAADGEPACLAVDFDLMRQTLWDAAPSPRSSKRRCAFLSLLKRRPR